MSKETKSLQNITSILKKISLKEAILSKLYFLVKFSSFGNDSKIYLANSEAVLHCAGWKQVPVSMRWKQTQLHFKACMESIDFICARKYMKVLFKFLNKYFLIFSCRRLYFLLIF